MTIPTFEEKLAGFEKLLATPDLTVEERYWVEIFLDLLKKGGFHEAWSRLRVQVANLEDIMFSAITKARQHARAA